ncbi:Glyoxalase/Bleomycin resistance protein/Dihydroxybiphenyl dioxygenase [Setomelanomma holmii]|uniref:Glyoxalase/Bleomycin resistance protein/Dihydroxybiphenyl dioxygenase n=1 Tax=Setomelanomma holmii TaxID=210430 RepID=A0A9P4LKB6_9PLEO|nr:Glyoxalase/Bleomycin resistance protein/Dihydroxybiphenyl dioxygenase [Setomelanomma holmii]
MPWLYGKVDYKNPPNLQNASSQSIPTRARLPQNIPPQYHRIIHIPRLSRRTQNKLNLTSQPTLHNHVINHIAISVPDLDAAVAFYGTCFGSKKIRSNRVTDRAAKPDAPLFRIYGDSLRKVRIALLGTGNGVGFEVFEFVEPAQRGVASGTFEYTRAGVFHIAVTTPDVEDAIACVRENGGSQIGQMVELGKDLDGVMRHAAYLRDPWGTVVEVLSCGFEALMANRE